MFVRTEEWEKIEHVRDIKIAEVSDLEKELI